MSAYAIVVAATFPVPAFVVVTFTFAAFLVVVAFVAFVVVAFVAFAFAFAAFLVAALTLPILRAHSAFARLFSRLGTTDSFGILAPRHRPFVGLALAADAPLATRAARGVVDLASEVDGAEVDVVVGAGHPRQGEQEQEQEQSHRANLLQSTGRR